MHILAAKIIRIIFKLAFTVFLLAIAIASLDYARKSINKDYDISKLEAERIRLTEELEEKIDDIKLKKDRLESTVIEINELNQKYSDINKIFKRITDWFRYWGEDYKEILKKREEMKSEISLKEKNKREIEKSITSLEFERKDIETNLNEVLKDIDNANADKNSIQKFKDFCSPYVWLAAKVLFILFTTWFLTKVIRYYIIANFIEKFAPIRLNDGIESVSITTSKSAPFLSYQLGSDEKMIVHERYIQANREGILKKTRFIFNSKYPFTSLASGLYNMVEYYYAVANKDDIYSKKNVTISNQIDSTEELSIVEIKDGSELIFRPLFLSGIIYGTDSMPTIKSYWCFNRIQAWLTFRFRYLSICGPCKLIMSAQRGVIQEDVIPPDGLRVNPKQAIAFNPRLGQNPIRTETFWIYLIGQQPLFDDFYTGEGEVVCQQVFGSRSGNPAASFWNTMLNAIGKVFGL